MYNDGSLCECRSKVIRQDRDTTTAGLWNNISLRDKEHSQFFFLFVPWEFYSTVHDILLFFTNVTPPPP